MKDTFKKILNTTIALLISAFILFLLYTIFTTQQKVNAVVRFINSSIEAQKQNTKVK